MERVATAGVLLVIVSAAAAAGAQPPLADAGLDQHVDQGEQVLVDGMGSSDPDGSIASYDWTIETPTGGTVAPACADCAWTWFRATAAGTYTVTLAVTDDDGMSRSDFLYVRVRPVASWLEPGSTTVGIGPVAPSLSSGDTPGGRAAGGGGSEPTVPGDVGVNDMSRSTWLGMPEQGGGSGGDLEITTYPSISPFGTAVGGVTYLNRPNGETESTTDAMLEVLVQTR